MPPPADVDVREFCGRHLDDPVRGLADLERIASNAGDSLAAEIVRLLPDVTDADLALVHMERFCRSGAVTSKRESLPVLLTLFGFSPWLADAVIADRECLPDLVRSRRLGPWGCADYAQALARWSRISHADDPWSTLRTFKRRAALRIALRDLDRMAPLPEICREISAAADALIQAGLQIALAMGESRYGLPQAIDEAGRVAESRMVVIALGKLGGNELNYSSDVDLLFLYSRDGITTGVMGRPETQITSREFFTFVAESLARGLSQISTDGQVFRVDCRLRPGGRDGDLVSSCQAAEAYYRTWARHWERQALIKARPCAGEISDGAGFLTCLEDVIYPQVTDSRIAENVREMKDRIDASLARGPRASADLKLGTGGIREVEFTVQALQMAHGGADPWIRGSNTLLALHRLADKGYLSVHEHGALSSAYTLLREVEHRIQLHRNLQRSSLPESSRSLRMLARAMGYRDTPRHLEGTLLLADLEAHRQPVRAAYDDVLSRLAQGRLQETPISDPFLDPLSDSGTEAILLAAGVVNPSALLGSVRAIRRLLQSPAVKASGRRAFRESTPALLKTLPQQRNQVRALRNLERYLESLCLEPAGFESLSSRPELLAALLPLLGGSQPLSANLFHRPSLAFAGEFDVAVARDTTPQEHRARIEANLVASPDRTEFTAFLRAYQRSQSLFIGLRDLNLQSPIESVASGLSDLAEATIQGAMARGMAETGWAKAAGKAARNDEAAGFCVLALGKLGYREIDYVSDLDLIFLYDAGLRADGARHADANRLARIIMELLTSITREGALYAVDTRLRPFGAEGELCQAAGNLEEYIASTAAIWELQSLLKARPIAGDLEWGSEVARKVEAGVLARASREDLAASISAMRTRLQEEASEHGGGSVDIKAGPGGLNAIQFAIQFLQLRHGIPSPSHKNTTRLLATLRDAGVVEEKAMLDLLRGYRFLRRAEHQIRLMNGRTGSRLPTSTEALDEVAEAMGCGDGRSPASSVLLVELQSHREAIEAACCRILGSS